MPSQTVKLDLLLRLLPFVEESDDNVDLVDFTQRVADRVRSHYDATDMPGSLSTVNTQAFQDAAREVKAIVLGGHLVSKSDDNQTITVDADPGNVVIRFGDEGVFVVIHEGGEEGKIVATTTAAYRDLEPE